MAIQFVTEDGTGKSDATSYLTTAEFTQYWENRGVDYSGKTADEIKASLNIATAFIDGLFPYLGAIEDYTQRLQFPRYYITDRNNVNYDGTVPPGVKDATAEAARYEIDGKDLFEIEAVIQSRTMGPVSVSYGSAGKKAAIAKRIERALSDYISQMRVTR